MRRASRGGDESGTGTPRQNGVSGGRGGARGAVAERGDAAVGGGDDDEAGCSPADMQDEDNDPARRREIRSKYRDLINSVQRE